MKKRITLCFAAFAASFVLVSCGSLSFNLQDVLNYYTGLSGNAYAAAAAGGSDAEESGAALEVEAAANAAAEAEEASVDYSRSENWAYFGIGEDKKADLFLICPTVDTKEEDYMSLSDEETMKKFFGALNMERGIYEDQTRMYAPYYRQATMRAYNLDPEKREPYLEFAFSDVSDAFGYYLENENNGRPIVLAGFSQGADMCYRLLEEYFGDKDLYDRLVAVYAIGWPCSREMINEYPQIKPAESKDDTGCVVTFECEAPEVTDTFIVPAGTKSFCINPLNWKTDSTKADKSENLGACFTNYSGEIKREEKEFCGCYIDEERGVLKVTDLGDEEFKPAIPNLPEGAYHIYDYQFFFCNLRQNVQDRIESFIAAGGNSGL